MACCRSTRQACGLHGQDLRVEILVTLGASVSTRILVVKQPVVTRPAQRSELTVGEHCAISFAGLIMRPLPRETQAATPRRLDLVFDARVEPGAFPVITPTV